MWRECNCFWMGGRLPFCVNGNYGGGRLVGIGKDDEPLDKDARPLVVGETWRRLVEKESKTRSRISSGFSKSTK